MEKLDGNTHNVIKENIEKLKSLFPETVSEDQIDFDKLKLLLGDVIRTENERYEFTWNGKNQAIQLAQKQTTGTLRPCLEESLNWQHTNNLYIEGDNLEVLRVLQNSYRNKVDIFYIDPPYNTGKDFIYKDNFQDNIKNYKEKTNEALKSNAETSGRFHTDWLNMIYPRLKIAKNLLKEDGVMFISIDDDEVYNLKKVCDEIFGEENFLANLVWEKKKKGSFLSKSITNIKEYALVYSKNIDRFEGLIGEIKTSIETYPCINASNKREIRRIPKGISSKYKELDYTLKKGSIISASTMNLVLHSDLVIRDGELAEELVIEGNWRYSQEAMEEYAHNQELYLTQDLYLRRIVSEPRYKTLKDLLPRVGLKAESSYKELNIENLFDTGWGSNEDADEELRKLMNLQGIMDYPKPVKYILKLVASTRKKDALVADFFSGSATTAHAVMQLNAEDNGKRKFLMVQLPERLDEHSIAAKAGYHTISEIGKERIRRAADKIHSEYPNARNMDLGFKVFKLDETNLKIWDETSIDLERDLFDLVDPVKEGRSSIDVAYEILLKYGIDLHVHLTEIEVANKTAISIADGSLVICLEKDLTLEEIEELAKLQPSRIVFYDEGFKDDTVRTNAEQILRRYGVEDIRVI
ncbi:site-specific DNA-methyltransferase [Cytobacillus spongiae]|uniref:site-specific DNA-methyltransferase n=1 Tax=Cytobacillus spongiae TaxID=2901381 RepID=UPI001F3BD94A|nr:site-specific DNA-methyltransferase [Cytobacillus spongiae]UII57088.1 site-specific DNA-methyltransferase [Cytobacillus spongiae]